MRGRRQNPGFRHAYFWCHSLFLEIFSSSFQTTFGAISFILSPYRCHFPFSVFLYIFQSFKFSSSTFPFLDIFLLLKLSHAFGAIFLVLKYILLFKPAFFPPSLSGFFAFRSHYGATLYQFECLCFNRSYLTPIPFSFCPFAWGKDIYCLQIQYVQLF